MNIIYFNLKHLPESDVAALRTMMAHLGGEVLSMGEVLVDRPETLYYFKSKRGATVAESVWACNGQKMECEKFKIGAGAWQVG